MISVPLSRGRVTIIDDADLHLTATRWTLRFHNGAPYAASRAGGKELTLHRAVIGTPPDGYEIDHINGDPLDNRRANLRFATHGQNLLNRKRYWQNKSGFKGVHYDFARNKWQALIGASGKRYALGRFDSAEAAARAYDVAAQHLHGEFARLNFPKAVREDMADGHDKLLLVIPGGLV